MFDDDDNGVGSAALLKAIMDKRNAPGPSPEGSVARVAEDYAKANKFKLGDVSDVTVKPNVSTKIAAAYDAMKHAPDDPKVQKAYKALVDETMSQFDEIKKSGLNIQKIKEGMPNPYPSSKHVVDDITKNKTYGTSPLKADMAQTQTLTSLNILFYKKQNT